MTPNPTPNKTVQERIAETFIPTEKVAAALAPNIPKIARELRDIAQEALKALEEKNIEKQQ